MFVKLPGPRHTAIEEGDSLVFRIPAKRNIFMVGFLTVWLCGWCFGEVSACVALFSFAHKALAPAAFLAVWLCAWTFGGAFAIHAWLWQVKGCEVIRISTTAISIKREIFGFGRVKLYDASEVSQLRVSPLTFNPADFRSGMAFWGIGGGALAFDYGFKTFRFGAGIDEAEARIILPTIIDRAPRLSQTAQR